MHILSGYLINSYLFYIGINAMTCVNEILSKKFIPAEYESFLLQMFQQTFKLLQLMTKGTNESVFLAIDDA